MFIITSEHPFSVNNFERKFQAKISPSDQIFEEQEEHLIEFKGKHHDELRKFSSGPIQNEGLTITSEHPSSGDHFESKPQANISPYDQSFEK